MGLFCAKELVRQALHELSGEDARRLLRKASEICSSESGQEAGLLLAHILALLALEEPTSHGRATHWRKCIQVVRQQIEIEPPQNLLVPDAYAMLAVDCVQDQYANFSSADRQILLRSALNIVDKALRNKDDDGFPSLLARKAAILRHLAHFQIIPKEQRKRLE
jgi:hypothetical protein